MKSIPLTQGKFALVDDEDFERVSQFRWKVHQINGRFYASRHIRVQKGLYRHQLLHRFILDAQPKTQVDHIDGNGLNCTRGNLRYATNAENNQNKDKPKNNTSGYKGVDWMPHKGKWRSRICVNGNQIHLGLFDDPVLAAKAYDVAALASHGRFARTNF